MKAMILASGTGSRLMPLTSHTPKCLIELDGEAILGRALRLLADAGISDAVITTGPNSGRIKEFVKHDFPAMKATYVHNPLYSSTNYIYSMWLAGGEICDDCILLHSDLIFDRSLLGDVIDSKKPSCVLVAREPSSPRKDFKARMERGRVTEISVDLRGEGVHPCMPLYKLARKDFALWMREIDMFVKQGKVSVYAEDAFNRVSGTLALYPAYYDNEMCMEIDDQFDLETARKRLAEK